MTGSSEIEKIITELGEDQGFSVRSISSLGGGSINEVFLLNTTSGDLVLKLNKASRFPGMFKAEKEGLLALRKTRTFDIPLVLSCGELGDYSFLLLEYKKGAAKRFRYWEIFAENLSQLHQTTEKYFGFSQSNYIGSLPQKNECTVSAAEFYITQRLEPQLHISRDQGFIFKDLHQILMNISAEIPEEPPSLIHGDLWNGNYITNGEGMPCLIDPAVSYAPRELDLAMMKLFGGFNDKVFQYYNEAFPLATGWQKRVPIWQLYYLLVHLNIFGGSYLSSVKTILKTYS